MLIHIYTLIWKETFEKTKDDSLKYLQINEMKFQIYRLFNALKGMIKRCISRQSVFFLSLPNSFNFLANFIYIS